MHCTVWSDSSSVDLSPSIHLRLVDPGVYRAAFQIHWVLLLSSLILLLFSSLFVFFFFFLFLFSPFLSSLLKKILRIPKSGPPVFTLLPQPRFSISRSTSFRGFELAWSEGELLSVLSFIHFSVALFVVTGVFFSLLAFFFSSLLLILHFLLRLSSSPGRKPRRSRYSNRSGLTFAFSLYISPTEKHILLSSLNLTLSTGCSQCCTKLWSAAVQLWSITLARFPQSYAPHHNNNNTIRDHGQ